MLDALEHAHGEVGLIHRDLKPANLMVNDLDDLKVADFGIARNLKDTVSRVSVKAASSGTLVYMSPQQLLGEMPCPADDIYALGATIYELLTGKPPFYSGDIATQVDGKIPPRLVERRAEFGVRGDAIPEAWETVIAACLEKSPKNRPVDMEAIRQGLKGLKFKRGSGDWKSRSAAATRSKNTAPAAASSLTVKAAAAAVLICGAGWYFGLHAPAQAKRESALAATNASETAADKKKRALADDDLARFEEDVKGLKEAADSFPSKKQLRETWEALHEKLALFDHPFSERDKELKDEVSRQLKRADADEQVEKEDYRKAVKEVEREMLALQVEDKRTDLSATVKRDAWSKLLQSFPKRGLDEIYGTDHEALQTDAQKAFVEWSNKALAETPAQPVPFPQVLSASFTTGWQEKEKKEKFKTALAALTREGVYHGKPEGDSPILVHESILAFQKREALPANGLLDDATLARLKVDNARPTIASSSSGGGSGGGGRTNSGGSNSSGSSGGGVPTWMKYIPAGGGPRFGRPF
jgi:serine/threonine protein kinase